MQTLYYWKDKYTNLEQNYFHLENSRSSKLEELNQILKKKEEEKKHLEEIHNVYENEQIKELDYFKLKSLENKILKSFDLIKEKKQQLLSEKALKYQEKRNCSICYEQEIKILIKPCNHLCLCSKCSDKVHSCPICRERIILKEIVKFN
jgi:hypothetical protein